MEEMWKILVEFSGISSQMQDIEKYTKIRRCKLIEKGIDET